LFVFFLAVFWRQVSAPWLLMALVGVEGFSTWVQSAKRTQQMLLDPTRTNSLFFLVLCVLEMLQFLLNLHLNFRLALRDFWFCSCK